MIVLDALLVLLLFCFLFLFDSFLMLVYLFFWVSCLVFMYSWYNSIELCSTYFRCCIFMFLQPFFIVARANNRLLRGFSHIHTRDFENYPKITKVRIASLIEMRAYLWYFFSLFSCSSEFQNVSHTCTVSINDFGKQETRFIFWCLFLFWTLHYMCVCCIWLYVFIGLTDWFKEKFRISIMK